METILFLTRQRQRAAVAAAEIQREPDEAAALEVERVETQADQLVDLETHLAQAHLKEITAEQVALLHLPVLVAVAHLHLAEQTHLEMVVAAETELHQPLLAHITLAVVVVVTLAELAHQMLADLAAAAMGVETE